MNRFFAIPTFCLVVSGATGVAAAPFSVPKPTPYFTAVSPIFGYDPAYGTLLGVAWFSYPTGAVDSAQTRKDLNLVMRMGPHGAVSYQQQMPNLIGDWGWDYRLSLNNFYDYTTAEQSTEILSESAQLTLAASTKARRHLSETTELYVGPAAHWQWQEQAEGTRQSHLFTGITYDRRDNPINSHQGYRLNADLKYQAPAMTNLHQENSLQLTLDARYFVPVFAQQTVAVHAQLQGAHNQGFRSEAGGSELLRGYLGSQFTGEAMAAAQMEYRFPIWRFIRGVTFVDAVSLWNDHKSQSYKTAGAGLRFGLPPDQSMSVRFDIAVNDHGEWLSYVNFNQVF